MKRGSRMNISKHGKTDVKSANDFNWCPHFWLFDDNLCWYSPKCVKWCRQYSDMSSHKMTVALIQIWGHCSTQNKTPYVSNCHARNHPDRRPEPIQLATQFPVSLSSWTWKFYAARVKSGSFVWTWTRNMQTRHAFGTYILRTTASEVNWKMSEPIHNTCVLTSICTSEVSLRVWLRAGNKFARI